MLEDRNEELLEEALDIDTLESVAGGAGANPNLAASDGTVVELLYNDRYRVDIDGQTVTARRSGKLRMNYIRLSVGDRVRVEGDVITYVYRNP